MLYVTTTSGTSDLQQILSLQRKNLVTNISKEEMLSQGFVTVNHSLEMLEMMHNLAPSIIIKDEETIVAYALTMLCDCKDLVPELKSMFYGFDTLQWRGKQLNEYKYYVMGQICIDKAYRGQGLFELLYQKHKDEYESKFDFIITEVATRNTRSMHAHKRIGFETVHVHKDELDEWEVVVWNWDTPQNTYRTLKRN
jgi:ribosomal protein S18 acetylase RimI-like enzyme